MNQKKKTGCFDCIRSFFCFARVIKMCIRDRLIGVPTFAVIYALIRNIAEYLLGKKGMVTQTPDFASQENPIFQKVKYHESSKAPHSVVEVCDLDGQQPETEEQRNAYKLQKSREEE